MNGKKLTIILAVILLAVACGELPQDAGGPDTESEVAEEEQAAAAPEGVAQEEEAAEAPALTPGSVAILLVDDFQTSGGGDFQAFKDVNRPEDRGGNCTVTPDGQGHFTAAGMGHFTAAGMGNYQFFAGVPHGALVYTKAQEQIEGRYGGPLEFVSGGDLEMHLANRLAAGEIPRGSWADLGLGWMGGVQRWDANGYPLLLVSVDTSGFDTGVIADRIRAAMEALVVSDWEISSFVINMSFAIVPCGMGMSLDDYREIVESDPELAHLREFLDENVGDPDVALIFASKVVDLRMTYENEAQTAFTISTQGGGDPLYNLLLDPPFKMIHIASSGNFRQLGFNYPFAPALWANVTSVSAEADYANPGEVVMEDRVVFDGREAVGTSFSAPALSVQAAVYLLGGGPVSCQGSAGMMNKPPLSYATEMGPWDNLPMEVAAEAYCEKFPNN